MATWEPTWEVSTAVSTNVSTGAWEVSTAGSTNVSTGAGEVSTAATATNVGTGQATRQTLKDTFVAWYALQDRGWAPRDRPVATKP